MEKKGKQVNVRLNEFQISVLQRIVDDGKAKSISGALVYLINSYSVTNTK